MAKKSLDNRETGFDSEKDLSCAFKASSVIKQRMRYRDWCSWEAHEVKGLFGIPDHMLVLWRASERGSYIVRTVSFEIKKEKWKRALIQAYKYSAFSDYSVVVMDNAYVHRALPSINVFKRSNIGLLSVSKNESVQWHVVPTLRKPYSENAQRILHGAIRSHLFGEEPLIMYGGPTIRWNLP